MATQILNILIKTKKAIKKLNINQKIIKQCILLLLIWNLILSILAIGTISYITIKEYKTAQTINCLDEIPEYELN